MVWCVKRGRRLRDAEAISTELTTRNATLEKALQEKELRVATLSSAITASENKV